MRRNRAANLVILLGVLSASLVAPAAEPVPPDSAATTLEVEWKRIEKPIWLAVEPMAPLASDARPIRSDTPPPPLPLAPLSVGPVPPIAAGEPVRQPTLLPLLLPAAFQQPAGDSTPAGQPSGSAAPSNLFGGADFSGPAPGSAAPSNLFGGAGIRDTSGLPAVGTGEAPTPPVAVPPPAPAGSTASVISGAGGQAGQALAAPSVADVLAKGSATTGVEVQRRNAVVSDARIRGLRAGQYATSGNGGTFLPARLDLDTAVSKFDPSSLRDVTVIKGPYSVLYGPAFSVLDVNSLDSPRFNTYEAHGRTAFSYQTSGLRSDALQSVWGGDRDWGFRATYNLLQGNDYKSGDGTAVPASYHSNNVNFAVGGDLTADTRLEVKGLRVLQGGLEFPGQYFDIAGLDTSALSVRLTADDLGWADRLDARAWFNSTAASGDTRGGAKQSFVQQLLFQSFNTQFAAGVPLARAAASPVVAALTDESTTRFANRTLGYRAMLDWGPKDDPRFVLGHDLNVYGQGLVENIRLTQTQGFNANTGQLVAPGAPAAFSQTQSIPDANQVDAGLFAQARVPVSPDLMLRAGGRVDWVHAGSNPRLITGNIDLFGAATTPGGTLNRVLLDPAIYSVDPTARDLTRTYVLPAGFVQGEYHLDPHWTALAAVGHAQRAPTLTELYAAGPFVGVLQQGTSRLIGDPNLSPERLTQFDVGLRADYEFVQVGANAYYANIRDYITFDLNKSGAGLIQVVYTNTDRATLAGGELFAQVDLTAWLTPFGTLSYVQGIDATARDDRRPPGLASSRRDDPLTGFRKAATEPLPLIPPLESRIGFRVHAPTRTPRWQVELSARLVAGQNSVATSLGEVATPGFATLTARGFVRLGERWLATAGVENLGNKNYREHLDPIAGNLLNVGGLFRPGTNFFFGLQAAY